MLSAKLIAQNFERDITKWMVQAAGPSRAFSEKHAGTSSMAATLEVCAEWAGCAVKSRAIPVEAELEFWGQDALSSSFQRHDVSLLYRHAF